MEILIGILIGVFLSAALSTVFWIICVMFNYNEKTVEILREIAIVFNSNNSYKFYVCNDK